MTVGSWYDAKHHYHTVYCMNKTLVYHSLVCMVMNDTSLRKALFGGLEQRPECKLKWLGQGSTIHHTDIQYNQTIIYHKKKGFTLKACYLQSDDSWNKADAFCPVKI